MELVSIRTVAGLCLLIGKVLCDYKCVCSYQVELEIHEKPDTSSSVTGYMYEYDCNPLYVIDGIDSQFSAVGNKGKLGYVQMTPNVWVQTCHGSIPDTDKVLMTIMTSTMLNLSTVTTTTSKTQTSISLVPITTIFHKSTPVTTTPFKTPI